MDTPFMGKTNGMKYLGPGIFQSIFQRTSIDGWPYHFLYGVEQKPWKWMFSQGPPILSHLSLLNSHQNGLKISNPSSLSSFGIIKSPELRTTNSLSQDQWEAWESRIYISIICLSMQSTPYRGRTRVTFRQVVGNDWSNLSCLSMKTYPRHQCGTAQNHHPHWII